VACCHQGCRYAFPVFSFFKHIISASTVAMPRLAGLFPFTQHLLNRPTTKSTMAAVGWLVGPLVLLAHRIKRRSQHVLAPRTRTCATFCNNVRTIRRGKAGNHEQALNIAKAHDGMSLRLRRHQQLEARLVKKQEVLFGSTSVCKIVPERNCKMTQKA
jgi:hypothetical protein